jgi:hypothetical protein
VKQDRVVSLLSNRTSALRTLQRIIAHKGFHTGSHIPGIVSNILRIISGSIPNDTLRELHVVYVNREDAWIAEARFVLAVAGQEDTRDLILGPFGGLSQSGVDVSIIEMGVTLMLGPAHLHIPTIGDVRSSHEPFFLPRLE